MLVLGGRGQPALFPQGQGFQQGARAERGQPVVQAVAGLVRCEDERLLPQDGPGVHLLAHLHDGDARMRFASGNGPLHGRGTTILG